MKIFESAEEFLHGLSMSLGGREQESHWSSNNGALLEKRAGCLERARPESRAEVATKSPWHQSGVCSRGRKIFGQKRILLKRELRK